MDARISTSVNTLQEQTIIHDSGAIGRPHRGFLYNPNLNKSLRYKGFGGYLVERDPLRQWGQAQFRMVLTNRWPRSTSTWLRLPKLLGEVGRGVDQDPVFAVRRDRIFRLELNAEFCGSCLRCATRYICRVRGHLRVRDCVALVHDRRYHINCRGARRLVRHLRHRIAKRRTPSSATLSKAGACSATAW